MFDPLRGSPASRTVLCVSALLGLNVYIAMRAFVCEYIPFMGSIEAAYIALARYILQHPFDLTWFPLWYTGVPYENTYPPLLHFIVAATARIGGLSPAGAYHWVGAAAYCLGPVTLFWLALRLSGRRLESFAAGLLYSLLSTSALLMPLVAGDLGSIWGPRRLHTLAVYGEAPHLLALTLLPVAVLALDRALERLRPLWVLTAALALAAVVLSNWLGAFALAVAVLALLAARYPTRPKAWLWAGGMGLLAYALASPWILPGNIGDIRRNAQHVVGSYPLGAEQFLLGLAVIALLAALFWMLGRAQAGPGLRFATLFSLAIGSVPLTAQWADRYILPQPERYHLEMEMGLSLVVALGLGYGLRKAPKAVLAVIGLLLLAGAVRQTIFYRNYARNMIQPFDITRTVEYRTANWLGQNLPGRRVFATGSVQFWLNAFADNPQVGGGFAQGIVNETIPMVHFGVPYTEGDGERSAMWLRVYGAQAVVVGGPDSQDQYKNWNDAAKFEGVLPELWRGGDDAVYLVPQRTNSLAHAVRREQLVSRPPINIEDIAAVAAYAAALEDRSLPDVAADWFAPGKARLKATLEQDHLISVQVACHEGWRAEVDNRAITTTCDELGFLVLEPQCSGDCDVELNFTGGLPAALARIASLGSLAGCLAWVYVDRRRRTTRTSTPDRPTPPSAG